MAEQENDEKISIILYYPGKYVLTVSSYPDTTIGKLKSLIDEKDVYFLHEGEYLLDCKNMSYYHIKNGETIVVMSSSRVQSKNNRWQQITRDREGFNEKINSVLNPNTSDQVARIRDIQLLRLEKKAKSFYRLIKSTIKDYDNLFSPSDESVPFVVPRKSKEISTSPLPIFWNKEKESNVMQSMDEILPPSYIPREEQIRVL